MRFDVLAPYWRGRFFMMFKPLAPGEHVIRVFGTDVRGANKTYTYDLHVE